MARHWYLPIKALKKFNIGVNEHCCHITCQLHVLLSVVHLHPPVGHDDDRSGHNNVKSSTGVTKKCEKLPKFPL